MQTHLSKLIDSLHYLMDEEQYEELYTQLQFSVPLLIEHGEFHTLKHIFERAIPLLLEQHLLMQTRSLLQLIMPHVPKTNAELYSLLQLALGHVYFLVNDKALAISHYRESLSYLMCCDPVPFARIGIVQSNLALMTVEEDSIETQLSYGRIITVLKHINSPSSRNEDQIATFSFYYETCLRAKRFDEAKSILNKWSQMDFTHSEREQLQFMAYNMLFHHATEQYDEAIAIGQSILQTYDHTKNISILLSIYEIVIECYTVRRDVEQAAKLQQQHDLLEQQFIEQRQAITQHFPVNMNLSLRKSSPLPHITEQMNVYDEHYVVVVFDLSTNDKALQLDYLRQLHAHLLNTCNGDLLYSTALKNYQSLYVFRGDEQTVHTHLQSLEHVMPFPMMFGHCASTHADNFTFEQCMHMCYAHIYYSYSQKNS